MVDFKQARRRRRGQKTSAEIKETVMRNVKVSGVSADDSEEVKERTVGVREFITEPAYVRVNAGVTKNLGDFESFRVDVSVSMPCYREDVNATFDEVSEWVSQRLADEVDDYLNDDEED